MVFNQFQTHTGEIVTGDRLQAACEAVALWYEENARACLTSDDYPPHVTQQTKEDLARQRYEWAESVRKRDNLTNFSVWQRVNARLTGECVAFLPK